MADRHRAAMRLLERMAEEHAGLTWSRPHEFHTAIGCQMCAEYEKLTGRFPGANKGEK